MTIAALLAVHNRKAKTVACLRTLFTTTKGVEVYLTDDASTDGTAEAVAAGFPNVHIIHGDGNLYWCRGMHAAWQEAIKGNYDYYLWLNDDIELYDGFLEELMECSRLADGGVAVGLVEDINNKGKIIYGGSLNEQKAQPTGEIQDVTGINGNVVLVPAAVVRKIGIIDPRFHHAGGDTDYGFTAEEHGLRVVCTRCAVAAGYANTINRARKWGVSCRERLAYIYSPLAVSPAQMLYLNRKHGHFIRGLALWAYRHLYNIMPDWAVALVWGDKFKPKKETYESNLNNETNA